MPMFRGCVLSVAVLMLTPWWIGASQEGPTQEPAPDTARIRASSNAVLIDVTVRDKKGRAVKGLKLGDFEVYEDGELQLPATAEEFDAATSEAPRRSSGGTPEATRTTGGPAPLIRSSLRGGLRDSCVSVLIPGLSPGGSGWVTAWKTLKDYIENFMPEGTRVGIFLVDLDMYRLKMIQFFTSDRKRLIEMADRARTDPAAVTLSGLAGAPAFGGPMGEQRGKWPISFNTYKPK